MPRFPFALLGLAAAIALAPVAPDALAQQKVYQWKDAQGRTHYSSAPPSRGEYSVRGVRAATPTAPAAAPAAAPETEQCRQARANLAILRNNAEVQMDTDGDGKPDRVLDAEQRNAQIKLAETILETNCKPR